MEIQADPVIDRMRSALGLTTDRALSQYFERGPSTVSNWRKRNSVPFTECVQLAVEKGMSLDWLILGVGDPQLSRHAIPDTAGADPRTQRLVGFVQHWQAVHGEDARAWLEMQFARAVPEYTEWVSARKTT